MKLLNIGFGNYIVAERIIAIVSPDSAPSKRLVTEAKERGMCIDATCGRRTKAVIVTDTDHVILSSLMVETLAGRIERSDDGDMADGETDDMRDMHEEEAEV